MGCGAHSKDGTWSLHSAPDQTGRTVLVTGGNSGCGLQTAKHFAALGAHVIITARDMKKGRKAREAIEAYAERHQSKHRKQRSQQQQPLQQPPMVDVEPLDLCDFASVEELARRINSRAHPFAGGLDVVVLNAGVMMLPKRRETKDGFETQWQTNHLGHFKLVGGILETLRRSQNHPTVVPVSSILAQQGCLSADSHFDECFRTGTSAGQYHSQQAYNDSKQAALLFATELHRRHGSWLRVMPCHPGASRTKLFRHNKYWAFGFMFQSADAGSKLELRAASDLELPPNTYVGTGGGFRGSPRPETPSARCTDGAAARALWEASEHATGTAY